MNFRRPILLLLAAFALSGADSLVRATEAHAFRVAPSRRRAFIGTPPVRPQIAQVPRRFGSPPIREVRQALRQLTPDLQRCVVDNPPPGRGRRRRMRVRVWLYPTGRFTMSIPEIQGPRGRSPEMAELRQCVHLAVSQRINPHMRRFRHRTRIKVERSYSVRVPGPPPSSDALSRLVNRRRTQITSCVPGTTRRGGEPTELVVRTVLSRQGRLEVVGIGASEEVLDRVAFDQLVSCVRRNLTSVHTEPVTRSVSFETTVQIRLGDRPPSQSPRGSGESTGAAETENGGSPGQTDGSTGGSEDRTPEPRRQTL